MGTNTYTLNATPATAAEAVFELIDMLRRRTAIAPNWIVRTSSTGAVYAQSGDVIKTAADLGNLAWIVLQGHAYKDGSNTYRRELCIQVDSDGSMRVKYSPRAGFVSGSPSATKVPSATDEQPFLGSGTDDSPTFMEFFPGVGYRMQGVAFEGTDLHYALCYAVGGGPAVALWYLDMPQTVLRSPGGALRDKDPALLYAATGSTCALADSLCADATAPRSVFRLGTAGQLWGRAAALASYADGDRVFPGGVATSQLYDSPSRPGESVRYLRRAALATALQTGEAGDPTTCDDKGYSSLLFWAGTTHTTPTLQDNLDDATGAASPRGSLAIGHVILPWIGEAIEI